MAGRPATASTHRVTSMQGRGVAWARGVLRGVEFGKLHAGVFLDGHAGIHGDGYAELPVDPAAPIASEAGFRIMELLFQHT